MVNRLVVKNAVNVFVSILLFTSYVYLFGIQSVKKYMEKEIIITEQKDANKYLNEPPPGIFDMYFRIYILFVTNQNCSHHNFSK